MSLGPVVQFAFVVDNLERAVHRWTSERGAGPFFLMPHVQIDDMRSRGKSIHFDYSGAVGQCGEVQIELIEQHDQTASLYTEVLGDKIQAFHHMAHLVIDFEVECANLKNITGEAEFSGRFGEIQFSYFDTRQEYGCMTEVLGQSEAISFMFDRVKQISSGWDGNRPLRHISELGS